MAAKVTQKTLSRDELLARFNKLLDDKKKQDAHVSTKEEDAARSKEREVVDSASAYTVESIVKGLADLQLLLGNSVDTLIERLTAEVTKLDELRRAIDVESSHARFVGDIKVAADALHLLTLEHKEAVRAFDEQTSQKRESIQQEIEKTRTQWAREQTEQETARKEQEERTGKERARAEADFLYEVERKKKVEQDAFTEKKRKLERDISEATQAKEKAWGEREKALDEKKAEFEGFLAKIQTQPQELEDAVKKAREEAIKDAYGDAKVRADLLEKEVEANRKVSQLQIQSLEETIAKQRAQLESLGAQLQAAQKEGQGLALRAIEGAAARAAAAPKVLPER